MCKANTSTLVDEHYTIMNASLLGHFRRPIAHTSEVHPRVLVAKPEGKRPLGKSRRRWEDNTKTDLKSGGKWIDLAQIRGR
jgi:hypothetical protein